jgi:hypothetical protein
MLSTLVEFGTENEFLLSIFQTVCDMMSFIKQGEKNYTVENCIYAAKNVNVMSESNPAFPSKSLGAASLSRERTIDPAAETLILPMRPVSQTPLDMNNAGNITSAAGRYPAGRAPAKEIRGAGPPSANTSAESVTHTILPTL